MINYPWTRREKRMKGIKTISNTVKVLIDIFDEALEIGLLFYSKFGNSNSVRRLVLSMLWVK